MAAPGALTFKALCVSGRWSLEAGACLTKTAAPWGGRPVQRVALWDYASGSRSKIETLSTLTVP
jgi:hypothetical protein